MKLSLTGEVRLDHALRQLYVLLPVLDDSKHYWVSDDEAAKLVRQGEGWLADHSKRELITRRYLAHQDSLVALTTDAIQAEADLPETAEHVSEPPLRAQRAEAVITALKAVGARRVVDMGCGSGLLLRRLQSDRSFTEVVGVDVSASSLKQAARRLRLAEASDAERERITLLHGSVVYRDDRLRGYGAMVLMEVIENVDVSRLDALEDAVFGAARSESVIVTTPNSEYNVRYEGLSPDEHRHDDHRFEWNRAEFERWVTGVCERRGYDYELRTVGEVDPSVGSPTQMAIFRRAAA